MGASAMMAKGGCAFVTQASGGNVRALDVFSSGGTVARRFAGFRFTDKLAPAIPSDGLVAEYLFDDSILDTSGFERNGIVKGVEQYADGYEGRSFLFNGSTHIEIPNIPLDSCTICALYKSNQPSSGYCIQLNGKYVLSTNSALRWIDGHSIYDYYGYLEEITFRQTSIDDSWHFVALVSNGQSNWRGCRDLETYDTMNNDSMGGYTNEGKSYIGAAGLYVGQYYYRPDITRDNIRNYNRALTDGEIKALAGEISYRNRINM